MCKSLLLGRQSAHSFSIGRQRVEQDRRFGTARYCRSYAYVDNCVDKCERAGLQAPLSGFCQATAPGFST